MQPPSSSIFKSVAQGLWLNSYRERIFAAMAYVYSSYFDESVDRVDGLFAVGGVIAKLPALFELDRKWSNLCDKHGIAYFKAHHCEFGKGEFAKFVGKPGSPTETEKLVLREIHASFIRLIVAEEVFGHGITVNRKDFSEITKDNSTAQAVLTATPYRLAYDLAMVQCAWMMKRVKEKCEEDSPFGRVEHPCVSFVCDQDKEHSPLADMAYRNLKKGTPEAAQYMASFTSLDDKTTPVLQAADAMAYLIRCSARVGLGIAEGHLSEEFDLVTKEHRLGIVQHVDKATLGNILIIQKPGEPYDLTDIMQKVFHEDIRYPSAGIAPKHRLNP